MNTISKIIIYWYVGLWVLAMIGGSNLRPLDFFFGIIFSLFVLTAYVIGVYSDSKDILRPKHCIKNNNNKKFLFLYSSSIISLVGSYYLTYFYTDNDLFTLLSNLINKQSNYYKYQNYIYEYNLTSFTINQLPLFILSIYVKLWTVYVYSTIVAKVDRIEKHQLAILIISSLSLIYQSLGRGTGIEIFELSFLIILSIIVRNSLLPTKINFINYYPYIIILSLALFYFNFNFSNRNLDEVSIYCITNDVCFDSSSIIANISSDAALITFRLEGYFSFGLYFLSTFVEESISVTSNLSLLNYIIPLNILFYPPTRSSICNIAIDCGATWMPDAIIYLEYFGLPLFIFILFYAGKITSNIFKKISSGPNFLKFGILYYLSLSMISIPVGNFLLSSQVNISCFLIIVFIFFINRFVFRKRQNSGYV
jgi:hypothetical protein